MWTEPAKDVSRRQRASGLRTPHRREDVTFQRKDVSNLPERGRRNHLLLPGDQFHHERIQSIPVPVSVVLHHVVVVEDALQAFPEVLRDLLAKRTYPAPNRFL